MSAINEELIFRSSMPVDKSGFAATEELLKSIAAAAAAVNATLRNGKTIAVATSAEWEAAFKKLNLSKGKLSLKGKNPLGEWVASFRKQLPQVKKLIKDLDDEMAKTLLGGVKYESDITGSKLAKQFSKQMQGMADQMARGTGSPLTDLLKELKGVGGAGAKLGGKLEIDATGLAASLAPGGKIPLVIAPERIVATLGEGNVQLILKGDVPVAGAKGGGGGAKGGGGAGGGAGGGGGGAADPSLGGMLPNELRQRIREAGGKVTKAITTLEQGLRVTRTTGGKDDVTVTERTAAADFARGLRARAIRATTSAYEAEQITPGMTRAQVLQTQAGTLRSLASDLRQIANEEQGTAAAKGELLRIEAMRQAAASLERQSAEKLARAAQLSANNANQLLDYRNMRLRFDRDEAQRQRKAVTEQDRFGKSQETALNAAQRRQAADQKRAANMLRQKQGQLGTDMTAEAALAEIAALKAAGWTQVKREESRGFKRSQGWTGTEMVRLSRTEGGQKETKQYDIASVGGQKVAATMRSASEAIKAARADLGGLTGDFVKNTEKVAAWASSVGLIYGALGLARQGLKAYLDTSYQLQRLDAVYGKVGGASKELMNDVLELAAAEGRAGAEAQASAIQWSRLGYTRAQVNEAVKVSLMGANVAEMEAAESTEHLSAITAAYRLEVYQLAGVLGRLNAVSNTYNVSNKDLLEGLSRTAAVAKPLGVGLSELIGLIGAGVGGTGQTGARIGKMLESVFVSMSRGDTQEFLSAKFNVQTKDTAGNLRDLSEVLRDLFVSYTALTRSEKGSLIERIAGKTQASRFAAELDNYIVAQRLAIDAQLNLNSAEKENDKILQSLKAQLQGAATELERFAFLQGDNGLGAGVGKLVSTATNLVRIMNLPGVSPVLTGVVALMAALAARTAVARLQADRLSESPGFAARSINSVRNAYRNLNAEVSRTAREFRTATANSGPFLSGLGRGAFGLDRQLRAGMRGGGLMGAGAGLGRLALGGAMTVGRMIPQIALASLAFTAFDKGMEAVLWSVGRSSAGNDRRVQQLSYARDRAEGRAGAGAMSARLMDTAAAVLTGAGADGQRNQILKELAQLPESIGLTVKELKALQTERNPDRIRGILGGARGRALGVASEARQEDLDRRMELVQSLETEVARLRGSLMPDRETLAAKEAELARAQTDALTANVALRDREQEALEQSVSYQERKLALLERQKAVLGQVGQFFDTSANDPVTARVAKLAALRTERMIIQERLKSSSETPAAQESWVSQMLGGPFAGQSDAALRAQMGIAQAGGGTASSAALRSELERRFNARRNTGRVESSALDDAGRKSLDERARELDREIATQESAGIDRLSELRSAQMRGAKLASGMSSVFAVGDNETEKMAGELRGLDALQQRFRLQAELAAERKDEVAMMEAAGALTAVLAQKEEALLGLKQRGHKLDQEQLQLQRDKTRELQKSLLTAGPEELLKKLAALDVTRRNPNGLNAGRFFALGSLREDVMAVPGFGMDDAKLRREANQFGRLGVNTDSVSQALRANGLRQQEAQGMMERFLKPLLGPLADSLGGATGRIEAAFDRLSNDGGALWRFEQALTALADKVDGLNLGGRGGGLPMGRSGAQPIALGGR